MTVEQTFVLASEAIDRQWGYTALSRARSGTRLYLAGTTDLGWDMPSAGHCCILGSCVASAYMGGQP